LQIEPKDRTYVNESETAYITATLTIPFACKSTEKQCPLFVCFYVPDSFLNNSYSDGCAIMFKNTEQVPVSKDIAIQPKGSDARHLIPSEIGYFFKFRCTKSRVYEWPYRWRTTDWYVLLIR